jgi:putative transcriptional regulator
MATKQTRSNQLQPAPGVLLIAEANLHDPNFRRTVVLLCEHKAEGSFGLILNHPVELRMSDLLQTKGWDSAVCRGGPVEETSLHFLHCRADLEIGGREVVPGVFWGGDFDKLNERLAAGVLTPAECRFYIGYSGWGEKQLDNEIAHNSWYLAKASKDLIFRENVNHWRETLKEMGPQYRLISTFPDDPRLN